MKGGVFRPCRSLGWAGLLVIAASAAVLSARAAPPDWVLGLARSEAPAFDPEVPAVMLLNERTLTINQKGVVTERTRGAMRILTQAGHRLAVARFDYVVGTSSVKNPSVWLVRAGKEFRPPKSRPWADVMSDAGASAYSEFRAKVMDYSELASNDDVFAWEGEVVGPLLFAQELHVWSHRLPTVAERFQITFPKTWAVSTFADGPRPPVEARSVGDQEVTLSWTLRDLPFKRDEPFPARDGVFHARILASFGPQAADGTLPVPFFRTWGDAAAWWRTLAAPQCDRSPAMTAEVAKLVAGCEDDLAKLRAVAGYVQRLLYVSADHAIGIGFGYRPRKASEVFSRGWGDCKDKANLMRAMLREAGIESAIAKIRMGGGRDIHPDWPTPYQFNHAILAIKVPPGARLPNSVQTRTMGEVVFFDPTDPHTWFGDLPYALQGATAHVIDETSDELVALPKLDPTESFRTDRTLRATLARDGSIQGTCEFVARGQSGAALRGMVRRWTARQLEENAGEFISDVLRGARVSGIKLSDDESAGHSKLSLEFSTPKAVQPLPGGAMLVRLDLLSRRGLPAFPAKTRTLPIHVPPAVLVDRVEIRLPEGYRAEDLPRPTQRQSPFGAYSMSVTGVDATIVADRTMRLSAEAIGVDEYGELRQFLNEVVAADKAAVVVAPRP